MRHFANVSLLVGLAVFAGLSFGQTDQRRDYPDGHGGTVTLPQGDRSFADKVVEYKPGSGRIAKSARDPKAALGPSDYSGNVDDGSFLTLGCSGSVVLEFTDNTLIDVEGPDLYVFEVGPKVEGMSLAISESGEDWIKLGGIGGGRADVDIAGAAQSGQGFRFVRLTDDDDGCGSRFAGADIDAVAAIGSAVRFVLEGEVEYRKNKHPFHPRPTGLDCC